MKSVAVITKSVCGHGCDIEIFSKEDGSFEGCTWERHISAAKLYCKQSGYEVVMGDK